MKNISITINYFGLIAEITNCSQEAIEVNKNETLEGLHNALIKKYKPLKKAVYKIAYNKKITSKQQALHHLDELALLPPFAGG